MQKKLISLLLAVIIVCASWMGAAAPAAADRFEFEGYLNRMGISWDELMLGLYHVTGGDDFGWREKCREEGGVLNESKLNEEENEQEYCMFAMLPDW